MAYKPSDTAYAEFVTSRFDTGAATTADSLPTGTFNRNGTDDGTTTVTVTNLDTGRYKASWTIPVGAAAGDSCMVTIAATVNSVAGKGVVWQAVLDGKRVTDIADANNRVDVIKIAGATQTARDIGASVLLSTGTGTGQLDFTSGVVKANLVQILATALTETAGLLAGGFKKFFNVAAPSLTCLGVDQTGDSFGRIGAAGAGLTAIGDARLAHLDADVSSRSTFAGGAVASVTAAVTVGTNNDKTGYGLSAAAVQAIWDALTSALTTVGSIGKRLVDYIDAAISSRSTYAGGDTSGTTTLLTRIPGTIQPQTGDSFARLGAPAGASVSADLAEIEAETDDITSVKAKTDALPADPASDTNVLTRLATSNYTAPDNATISAINTLLGEMNGLLGKNSGVRNMIYVGGNLVSFDLCLYDNSSHAATNDGSTGLVHKYVIAHTFDGSNNLTSEVTTRVS
jgi:hypothetical protein